MFRLWKVYGSIALVVLIFVGGLGLGWKLFSPSKMTTQVTATTILTNLQQQGFFVTQTYVFDEPVTISKQSGNVFKDFFLGQTITARGVMNVNVGTDLSSLTDADVELSADHVRIHVPDVRVFDAHLVGPVDLKNDQGILKRIIENDDGYNAALDELTKQAKAAATQPELMKQAREAAKKQLMQLLNVMLPGRTVEVTVG